MIYKQWLIYRQEHTSRSISGATGSRLARRRDGPAEPVRIPEAEGAHAPHVGRLGVQNATGLFRPGGDGVDVLRRRELEREAVALLTLALRAVVLGQQDANVARAHGC